MASTQWITNITRLVLLGWAAVHGPSLSAEVVRILATLRHQEVRGSRHAVASTLSGPAHNSVNKHVCKLMYACNAGNGKLGIVHHSR